MFRQVGCILVRDHLFGLDGRNRKYLLQHGYLSGHADKLRIDDIDLIVGIIEEGVHQQMQAFARVDPGEEAEGQWTVDGARARCG